MSEPNPQAALKAIRIKLDYTQEEMAHQLGLRLRTYVRYESGETVKMPATVLLKAQGLKRKSG